MIRTMFFFGQFRWSFWRYVQRPLDDKDIFKAMLKKARSDEQILVHREGSWIYYAYILRLSHSQNFGIGIRSDMLFTNFPALFSFFDKVIDRLSEEELIIKRNEGGGIRARLESFDRKRTEIDILLRELGEHYPSDTISLETLSIGVGAEETVKCELWKKKSRWLVEQMKVGYHNAYIVRNFQKIHSSLYYSLRKMISFAFLIVGLSFLLWLCLTVRNIHNEIVMVGKIEKEVNGFIFINKGKLKDIPSEFYTKRDTVIGYFYISKYELTRKEFYRVMGYLPEGQDCKGKEGEKPVIAMPNEFIEYCNKRSKLEGYSGFYYDSISKNIEFNKQGNGYRLPTRFEWAYAALEGGSFRNTDDLSEVAWMGSNCSELKRVGQKNPNSLGLYDMFGNAAELTQPERGESLRASGGDYTLKDKEEFQPFSRTDLMYYDEKRKRPASEPTYLEENDQLVKPYPKLEFRMHPSGARIVYIPKHELFN